MDITALFLGPKSENNETFRQFFDAIVEDILNFRNNYHPDEPPIISERHKLSEAYVTTRADFMQELKTILSKLRAHSIPAWDTSYIAHMNSDLVYPAIAGYISSIMYNPNNVTGEVSSVTTQWEMDFINYLCEMVGYPLFSAVVKDPDEEGLHAWGHITSGGTVANIEGLWVARNLKYLPLSLKLAASEDPEKFGFLDDVSFTWFNGQDTSIGRLDYPSLFNMSPDLIYAMMNSLTKAYHAKYPDRGALLHDIREYSLQYLGIHGIHALIRKQAGDDLAFPVVLVAQTRHYCWEKSLEVLGLGMHQLKTIPADQNYRLDMEALETWLQDHSDTPVLAVVPIIGTTEEGVMDPMHKLAALRIRLEQDMGRSFYIHADAAYGGYYAAMFSADDFSKHKTAEDALNEFASHTQKNEKGYLITDEGFAIKPDELEAVRTSLEQIFESLEALKHADSITIDPHKLGYIPYPAGSVLFKNNQSKSLISFEAPYLKWSGDVQPDTERVFLGQATLEGSRPGAAAAACYLASRIVPLNIRGHGKIMLYNMIAARKFFNSIPPEKPGGCKIIPQYDPETNVVCYSIGYPGVVEHPKYMNLLANKVFDNMTKKLDKQTSSYEYFISKTNISYRDYPGQISAMFDQAAIPKKNHELLSTDEDGEFFVLRSVLMNPLALGLPDDYYSGFWSKVSQIADEALEDILSDIIQNRFHNKRVKVLWIENMEAVENLKNIIETSVLGRYFSFYFLSDNESVCDFMYRAGNESDAMGEETDMVITDLCLDGSYDDQTDVSRMYPVVQRAVEDKKQVICYSKYVADDHRRSSEVKKRLVEVATADGHAANEQLLHFVGKTVGGKDRKPLYHTVESVQEALSDDMNMLLKKLILALQRLA